MPTIRSTIARSRKRLLPSAAAIAAGIFLIVSVLWWPFNTPHLGIREPQRLPWNVAAAVTPQDMPRVGIAAGGGLASMPPNAMRAEIDSMGSYGVHLVRYDNPMDLTQSYAPTPGFAPSYNWGPTDRVINAVSGHRMWTQLVVANPPAWMVDRKSCGQDACMPHGPNAVQQVHDYAVALAQRYHLLVRVWEFLNECNMGGNNYPSMQADPANYAQLLIAFADGIKSVDPGALVYPCGLAPANTDKLTGDMDPRAFFAQMMRAGGMKLAHLIAGPNCHPYGFPAQPDGHEEWNTWWRCTTGVLAIAQHWGFTQLEMSEYGAPTAGPNHVDVGTQSSMLEQAIHLVITSSNIRPLFLFNWEDNEDGAYGLLTCASVDPKRGPGACAAAGTPKDAINFPAVFQPSLSNG